jgi:hypothetical protein
MRLPLKVERLKVRQTLSEARSVLRQNLVLRELKTKTLESLGDKTPRGMIAHDRIRLTAFPDFLEV